VTSLVLSQEALSPWTGSLNVRSAERWIGHAGTVGHRQSKRTGLRDNEHPVSVLPSSGFEVDRQHYQTLWQLLEAVDGCALRSVMSTRALDDRARRAICIGWGMQVRSHKGGGDEWGWVAAQNREAFGTSSGAAVGILGLAGAFCRSVALLFA
jgi:hypothetical protein